MGIAAVPDAAALPCHLCLNAIERTCIGGSMVRRTCGCVGETDTIISMADRRVADVFISKVVAAVDEGEALKMLVKRDLAAYSITES